VTLARKHALHVEFMIRHIPFSSVPERCANLSLPPRRPRLLQFRRRALPKIFTFPNGLKITYVSKEDAVFLYKEIFEDQGYLKGGISLKAGDVVLDIGANIGLFSLYCRNLVGMKGRVVAVEPIPEIYAALEYNTARHNAGFETSQIKLINAGVSNGSASTTSFTFYPRAAGWSSMLPDRQDVNASMLQFLRSSVKKNQRLSQDLRGRLVEALLRILPGPVFEVASRMIVWFMMSGKRTVGCKLLTVSDIIRQQRVDVIHLLKIDVERAELDVLKGIDERDWAKIQQIAMEVHERAGGLQSVLDLLLSKGFQISSSGGNLEGTGLENVFARR